MLLVSSLLPARAVRPGGADGAVVSSASDGHPGRLRGCRGSLLCGLRRNAGGPRQKVSAGLGGAALVPGRTAGGRT